MGNSTASQDELKIKILTGQTQSLQLFDFHSPQKQQSISDLKFPSFIGYSEAGDLVYSSDQILQNRIQPVYRIQRNNFRDIVVRQYFERTQQDDYNYLWKVLTDGQLMQLQKGDSIKIGKIKIKFKEIINKTAQFHNQSTNKNITLNVTDRQQTQRMDLSNTKDIGIRPTDGQCRLCFQNTQSVQNPLVSLCKCSGSVKYIHYECLKDWISNNVKKQKSPNCLFYSYLEPNCCQLCKQPLNNQFTHEGQRYSLYEYEKLEPPYAIFESRYFDQQISKTRVSVYTISLPESRQIAIGRNPNSQVILRDISVSRNHCLLVYKHGSLFIQDKKSKFGTLVCPKRGFQFNSVNGLQLQYQSKIIQIFQAKVFNSCCCAENNSYFVEINKGSNEQIF